MILYITTLLAWTSMSSLSISFYIPFGNLSNMSICHISAQNHWINDKLINKTVKCYLSRPIPISHIDIIHSNKFFAVPTHALLNQPSILSSKDLLTTIWLCLLPTAWKSLDYHNTRPSDTPSKKMSDVLLMIILLDFL